MTVKECYEAIESDYNDVLSRLRTDERIQRFLLKVLEDGSYELLVGASSDDIRPRISIEVEGSTASTGDILAPAQTLDLLRR